MQKIHIGLLMRAVKNQDYSKISDDMREIESVTKMRKLWASIEKNLKKPIANYRESKKPSMDLKAIINEKLTKGLYKND